MGTCGVIVQRAECIRKLAIIGLVLAIIIFVLGICGASLWCIGCGYWGYHAFWCCVIGVINGIVGIIGLKQSNPILLIIHCVLCVISAFFDFSLIAGCIKVWMWHAGGHMDSAGLVIIYVLMFFVGLGHLIVNIMATYYMLVDWLRGGVGGEP